MQTPMPDASGPSDGIVAVEELQILCETLTLQRSD